LTTINFELKCPVTLLTKIGKIIDPETRLLSAIYDVSGRGNNTEKIIVRSIRQNSQVRDQYNVDVSRLDD